MKALKFYQCETCGTMFNEEEKAKKCEQTHKKRIKIVSAKYRPYTSEKSGIPDIIIAKFEDGSEVKYKR